MILGNFQTRRIGIQQYIAALGKLLGMASLMLVLSACEVSDSPVGPQGTNGGPTTPPPPGSPPAPPPPPTPPPATDQAIFEATLHPELTNAANYCAGCHGVAQDPLISVTDATTAYNAITSQQKVNLSNPALSRIYLRPKDDRHNCNGDVECDRVATDFLAAIQDWATQAAAAAPPPSGAEPVLSAAATFADATPGGVARVDDANIAMFTFAEGTGDVTVDTSGVGTPITLNLTGTEWLPEGGLKIVSGKAQASAADSAKLADMITPANEYTVEAWIIPELDDQTGPARIVSYSVDSTARNFTMGQNGTVYQLRNSSVGTGLNGAPALDVVDPVVATELTHVAMTFDAVTGRRIFVNGQLSVEENVADDALVWANDQILVLGNETTDDRLWQGTFQMVAIHNRALNDVEIQQNFASGGGQVLTMRFDIADKIGQAGSVDLLFAQLGESGYMFANPTFVSDATGVAIKNIRIGLNGGVPVAAQPFRRIDVMATQSGQLLSPLGAAIPAELGVDQDVFHLEFEMLGDNQGLAELPVASQPPLPVADVIEPDFGVRDFAQLNDAMSSLTGVDKNTNAVLATYSEVRDSLPPTNDMLAFGNAQQLAIQRLATSYCGVVVQNNASCDALFGNCAVDGAAKDQVATALYGQFVGNNIAEQPDLVDVNTEIVRMIDDLGCAAGCNGAEGETVLQATCAAVLSSAAVSVD